MVDYDFGFGTMPETFTADDIEFIWAIFNMIFIVGIAIAFVFFVVTHIFKAIGLQKIAEKRGMDNPWMAWIPVVNAFTTGAICDDINSKRGKKSYFGIFYLIVSFINFIVLFLAMSSIYEMGSNIITHLNIIDAYSEAEFFNLISSSNIMLLSTLSFPVGIGHTVLLLMTTHKIMSEYTPDSAVVKTVLSFFFEFLPPFFFFAARNKEPYVPYGYENPAYGANTPPPQMPYNQQNFTQQTPQNPQTGIDNSSQSPLDANVDVFNEPPKSE